MDESTDKELPQIVITSIDADENGNTNLSFEVDDDFLDYIKKEKGIDEVSREVLSDFVKQLLENCSNGKDGYGYHTLNKNDS